jgi:predicted nucleic acid-binding protein
MILVDLNVTSAAVLEAVVGGRVVGALPAHAVTTVHYIVHKYRGVSAANQAVDWLLRYLRILPVQHAELMRARALGWSDYEDAVIAAAAESSGCEAVITRNVKDFASSPVTALTPEEYLVTLGD